MADNVTFTRGNAATPPTATVVASDDIGGVQYPRAKISWGVDGAAVDASATDPLPVTATQSGTWTVQPGNTANTTAWKVDASSVAVPVTDNSGSLTVDGTVAATQSGTWNVTNVSGTVSLPTGASTAAKQPALGTAGTASADVITVQGIASMTALKVDGSAVTQPVSGTVTAHAGTGPWPVTDNSGSLTVDAPVGTPVFVRLSDGASAITALPVTDNSGSLTVDNAGTFATQATLQAGTAVVGKVGIDQTTPGTTNLVALAANQSVNVAQINGVTTTMGNGVSGTGVQRVTIASDSTGVVGLNSGTNTIGKTYAALQTTKALTNANVSFSSSGENTVVSGTASQTIRVFAGSFSAASAVTMTIKDAASGTTLATVPLLSGGSFNFDTIQSGEPLFVTASSGAFIISLSSAVSVTGFVQYTKS